MKRERFSKRWSPSFDRLPQQPWLSAVELANGRPYCGQKRKLINRQWTLLGRLSCQLKRFEKVQNLKFKTWKFANESFTYISVLSTLIPQFSVASSSTVWRWLVRQMKRKNFNKKHPKKSDRIRKWSQIFETHKKWKKCANLHRPA